MLVQGGAGSAVAFAAAKLGIKHLAIVDQNFDRARALSERLQMIAPEMVSLATLGLQEALRTADGLIHATPTGMMQSPGVAVPATLLRPSLWVAEIVYLPLVTELLAAARKINCRTLDGGGMGVFQAVAAFQLFTGIRPNAERMRQSFLVAA